MHCLHVQKFNGVLILPLPALIIVRKFPVRNPKTMNQRTTTVLCMLFLSAAGAFCQVNTASLTGLVRDSTDAIVTDATITARSTTTGIERTTETNSSGYYF